MADILSKLQGGDLEKNIEEIIQKVGGLQIPEENGGEGSSTNTTTSTSTPATSEQEQADLETMLSALAALEGESNPESTAASITEKLKKIADNAKNITVCLIFITTDIFTFVFSHIQVIYIKLIILRTMMLVARN